MRAKVLSIEVMEPLLHDGGIASFPCFGEWSGAEQLVSGMSVFPPGMVIVEHTHNVEEIVVVIGGEGTAVIDGQVHPVKAVSTTWIPADVPHYFENTGEGDLTILWIYGGTEVLRTIVATGEVTPHLPRTIAR